jgi:phosphatidate cytidylyltransferase
VRGIGKVEVVDQADESSPDVGDVPRRGPTTDQLRIAAIEAAVAAGLSEAAPSDAANPEQAGEPHGLTIPHASRVAPLPDWVDPPTGQVPAVLLDGEEEPSDGLRATRGPTWRERAADWDDDLGLGSIEELADATSEVAGRAPEVDPLDPFDFAGLEEVTPAGRFEPKAPAEAPEDGAAAQAWAAFAAGQGSFAKDDVFLDGPRSRRGRHRVAQRTIWPGRRRAGSSTKASTAGSGLAEHEASIVAEGAALAARSAPTSAASRRNPFVATATGLVVGAVALACFLGGAVPTLVLVTVVTTLAAGESFATFRRAGRRPATLVGLVAIAALVIGAYLFGPIAIAVVVVATVVVAAIWYLAQAGDDPVGRGGPSFTRRSPAADLGATILVVAWVGVLGAFAGLLLSPSRFPDRHGVGFLLAAVLLTVSHDVGSYAAGARLGRHRVLPSVSPNKTWEGLAGGSILTFVVAVVGVSHLHPIDLVAALGLAALVCVLGPLGDLTESLVKRDLGVKDMGQLLPAHGGLFDRIDAMLFVLPAAYFLFRLAHLS